jgi:type IX secretion system PorP/SprF family membrane protein
MKRQNLRQALLLTSCFLTASGAYAQNYSVYSSYFLNPYVYNPAEAATDQLRINAGYRRQWTGIADAPKILFLTGTTLINNTRAGVGLKVNSISRGFLSTTEVSATYAYGVPLNSTSKLFFGLSGGMMKNGIDWGEVSDPSDPALSTIANSTIPSAAFGMLYRHASGFNFGVSLPKMFSNETLGPEFTFAPVDNIVVSAYYRKEPPKKTTSHPAALKKKKGKKKTKYVPVEFYTLYRYSDIGGQFEVSGKLNLSPALWLAATYRQEAGFIPSIGLNMGNLSLGYFYEFGSNSDIALTSHEIMLGVRLGDNKFREKEQPVIVKRPTTTTPAPATTQPKPAEPKPAETKPVTAPVAVAAAPEVVAAAPMAERAHTHTDSAAIAAVHAEERKQLDEHLDDHKEGAHDDEHNHPVNERHEFVKRGTHHEELDHGTHVIAGAFQSRTNAEHYATNLKALGYDADFGHLTAKNLWYVFISHDTEIEQAKAERNVLQKKKMFKDVWLLTVHE